MDIIDQLDEEFEARYHITTDLEPDGYWVWVSKVGGGTIGRLYIGQWMWAVMYGDDGIVDRWDAGGNGCVHTGVNRSHYQAANLAVDFAEESK